MKGKLCLFGLLPFCLLVQKGIQPSFPVTTPYLNNIDDDLVYVSPLMFTSLFKLSTGKVF